MNIDVTDIARVGAGAYISKIASAENPVLLFMPNLDYSGMGDAEQLADDFKIGILNIPITLAVMDLSKQMEYAGIELNADLIRDLEHGIRKMLIEIV